MNNLPHFLKSILKLSGIVMLAIILSSFYSVTYADNSTPGTPGSAKMGRLNQKAETDPGRRSFVLEQGYIYRMNIDASDNPACPNIAGRQYVDTPEKCPPNYRPTWNITLLNSDRDISSGDKSKVGTKGIKNFDIFAQINEKDYPAPTGGYRLLICGHVYYVKHGSNSTSISFSYSIICSKSK